MHFFIFRSNAFCLSQCNYRLYGAGYQFSGRTSSYEELEKRVKARLKSLDVDTEGKNFVQAYTWELASTLAKIKEAKNVSNLFAQYLYGYGASGIAIRVYRISFSTPNDRVKKPDAGPFQYRIAIDEI